MIYATLGQVSNNSVNGFNVDYQSFLQQKMKSEYNKNKVD